MDRSSNKNKSLLICLILIVTTFAVYYQVHNFAFVNFDDPVYVYKNPDIQAGITLKAIKWAFSSISCADIWHPLTWLSHMLDWQLFGPNAGGHHLTNLVFHIANTILLFVVLKRMTNVLWQSAFAAALFALHPLHVESVAWVSERKDVLSTFFWMLTMWVYVRYAGRPKIDNYLLVIVFFALGLMSKAMLVTLPFVLLLLDYWPLERYSTKRSLSHLLIEKIPLFVMALAASVVAFIAQKRGGAMHTIEHGLAVRLANAAISYMQYIIKMVWPFRLAMFYPHPRQGVSILYAVMSAVFLAAATILVLRFAKGRRYLFTGWFWYVGTLVPVIGIVQVGDQAMADRYSYISLTGLFIIIAWGLPELAKKWAHRKIVLWVSSLTVISALSVCTYRQAQYWKDTITLCEHALKVTKDNYEAHSCMIGMLIEQGRIEEAAWHNKEAIRIRSGYLEKHLAMAEELKRKGQLAESIKKYQAAIMANENISTVAYNEIGLIQAQMGKPAEAVKSFDKAIRYNEENGNENHVGSIHYSIGVVLQGLGKTKEAMEHFNKAVEDYRQELAEKPDSPTIFARLGDALATMGDFKAAAEAFEKALELEPNNPEYYNNLEKALEYGGQYDKAIDVTKKQILLMQSYNQEKEVSRLRQYIDFLEHKKLKQK
jgi:tetratricopeptide (TPR) repeat protein